eukprot:TRINITY_DN15749_c0_g1_i1.p1 TRINITY_DN15749_c0_g1~~TRINITY_DN15749_c0_g1_i1.p1  ORF type:complete len:608 (-),score=130.10 TRINITY_DN15749_c0_g1_i1:100-1923(-)
MKRLTEKKPSSPHPHHEISISHANATSTPNNPDLSTLMLKSPLKWTVQEVCWWLEHIDCKDCCKAFEDNSISGDVLFDLTEDDLAPLNLPKKSVAIIFYKINALARSFHSSETSSTMSSCLSHDSRDTDSDYSNVSQRDEYRIVKCKFGDETRLFKIVDGTSFRRLKKIIKREFGERVSIQWIDQDDDKISIKSDSTWKTVLSATSSTGTLRLHLTTKGPFSSKELALLGSLVDGVVIIDEKAKMCYFNRSAEALFGYRKEEVVGRNVSVLMPPEHGLKHDSYVDSYLRTGHAKIIGIGRATTAQGKSGERFAVFLSVNEARRGGNKIFFVGTLKPTNVLASALKEGPDIGPDSNEQLFLLLDNLLDPSVAIDHQSVVLFVSKSLPQLLGYSGSNLLGKNFRTILSTSHDDDDGPVQRFLMEGDPKILGKERQVVARHKEGYHLRVQMMLTEHHNHHSNSQHGSMFSVVLRSLEENVDRSKKLEKSLLEIERTVLDNLVVPAIILNEKGLINAYNPASEKLFGYSLVEVIGKNVKMLMTSPDKENHDEYLKSYIETGDSRVIGASRPVIAMHKDGTMFPVLLSLTAKKSESGQHIFTGILQKIESDD